MLGLVSFEESYIKQLYTLNEAAKRSIYLLVCYHDIADHRVTFMAKQSVS